MAFKKTSPRTAAPETPDLLFRELPRRKIPDVLPHQQSMMQRYASEAVDKPDVALQLPTGSGKTLVGLLIGEWRRKKFSEKVVYLCPTKQLVHQVVNQANNKYGLSVVGFTGSKQAYSPSDITKYNQGESIAITTYNSLFNTNPFFGDADVIIIDDSHAAENYVAKLWTLNIERHLREHESLHSVISSILKPHIDATSFKRLIGNVESPADLAWVDKLPTNIFIKLNDEISNVLDTYTRENDLRYPWSMLRDNLNACHLYMTPTEIMIRPLIPPTWNHHAFNQAGQRIYMSATLGEGGDLERLLGRKQIFRLPVPDGWDTQGVGRRFFMFPSLSLNDEEAIRLRRSLLRLVDKSLILVPSERVENEIAQDVITHLNLNVFSARDIEESKDQFIESTKSVAIVANRYDGIDFPGEECRLLMIDGFPRAVNAQERFLMSRMGANLLFNERIQTRVLQAIGRCTRSLEDYSAVIVTGDELPEYLADPHRRKYFHPELQAELSFGVQQSIDVSVSDFEDNFKIFIENSDDWEEANKDIIEQRKGCSQTTFPGMSELEAAVRFEIEYQMAICQQDYITALAKAESVIGVLKDTNLRGYRALWEYLAGSAAVLADTMGTGESLQIKAQEHFSRAKKAATTLPWLVKLAEYSGGNSENTQSQNENINLMFQVENIEILLISLGTLHDRDFSEREKYILDGICQVKEFENAHKLLGEHLGFNVGNDESSAAPDPWWQSGNQCIVFEDHAEAEESSALSPTKARQASSHPTWIRENVETCKDGVNILPVLLTPVGKAHEGALTHLGEVSLWKLSEFQEWTKTALAVIREIRQTFVERGDLDWQARTADKLVAKGLDMAGITSRLNTNIAKDLLKEI